MRAHGVSLVEPSARSPEASLAQPKTQTALHSRTGFQRPEIPTTCLLAGILGLSLSTWFTLLHDVSDRMKVPLNCTYV